MVDSPLITKSKEFALQIIKVCNYVKQNKKESVLKKLAEDYYRWLDSGLK